MYALECLLLRCPLLMRLPPPRSPQGILVSGKPHLGTDRLVRLLKAFRQHLVGLGAEVRFGARVEDLLLEGGRVAGVRLAGGGEVRGSRVVLAVGHSAREVYRCLYRHAPAALEAKPFAMGFRVEHPQALIDAAQYGEADAATGGEGVGSWVVWVVGEWPGWRAPCSRPRVQGCWA